VFREHELKLDMLLVQINPLVREDLPDAAQEIIERVNEII
jgi:hypothetical protein